MEMIQIKGVGYAQAQQKVTNEDLSKIVDTSDEWIRQRTGIQTRFVTVDENTSDLSYRASLRAIQDAQIHPTDIDLIICATATPDNVTPAVACLIQERLGLNGQHVMAFDLNAACSGFVFGLQVAGYMLKGYHCALVIGAETLSKVVDWTDRNTCVLFGDGAGAAILKPSTSKHMSSFAQSIGDAKGVLTARGFALKKPLVNGDKDYSYLYMDGREVYRFAVGAMQEAIEKVLQQEQIDLEDIDLIIPHQANLRIIKHVAKRMKLDESRFYVNVQEYGNTSAASIAIALASAKEEGYLHEGMKIVLTGFGGGLTYGAVYIEW